MVPPRVSFHDHELMIPQKVSFHEKKNALQKARSILNIHLVPGGHSHT